MDADNVTTVLYGNRVSTRCEIYQRLVGLTLRRKMEVCTWWVWLCLMAMNNSLRSIGVGASRTMRGSDVYGEMRLKFCKLTGRCGIPSSLTSY